MPFELPDNLHPDCGPVAWMLGTWRGNGHVETAEAGKVEFAQELVFAHDGRAFLHFFSRAWVPDPDAPQGPPLREDALETGFLRCLPEGRVEMVMAHPGGFAEIYYGTAAGGKLDLATDAVARTGTAEARTAATRLYGNVEGDLLYAYDVATEGHGLAPQRWARLQRA